MRDAQHLHSMISNTSDLAEKVSSKVRLLDLVKVGHGHIGYSGLPWSGKSQGKSKIFQGQGKVREFCKRSGKISVLVKVSEKSGNFVFRFCEVYEDIFIRKKKKL